MENYEEEENDTSRMELISSPNNIRPKLHPLKQMVKKQKCTTKKTKIQVSNKTPFTNKINYALVKEHKLVGEAAIRKKP